MLVREKVVQLELMEYPVRQAFPVTAEVSVEPVHGRFLHLDHKVIFNKTIGVALAELGKMERKEN